MKFIRQFICGGEQVVSPLYQAIEVIGPVMMGIVALLGVIYGIILGTKYAQATKSEDKAALQKALINGVIGFVAIFVLVTILYAIRDPLVKWMG